MKSLGRRLERINSPITLAGVSEAYVAAFREWAELRQSEILLLEDDGPALPREEHLALCAVELSGDRASCVQRLRGLRKRAQRCPVVVLGSGISVDTAVALLREGACDVIELPAPPADVVARSLVNAADSRCNVGAPDLVGTSPAMRELRREVDALARIRSTALLIGETGVGKGLVARMLHQRSDRFREPFVHVDCASLARSVVESELFGHEHGSFTGAVGRRAGRFEQAGAGTIFLDEIGELEPPLQAKLLRILHDRTFERIGGSKTLSMNARVVAATNRNLGEEVREGSFRSDLYFRLRVFELKIPPLRERLSDVPVLVHHAIAELCDRLSLVPPVVPDDFHQLLLRQRWPGNVRELYNLIERLLVTCEDGVLDAGRAAALLPDTPCETPCDLAAADTFTAATTVAAPESNEKQQIANALIATGGNIARAARRLALPRSTLRYRIRRHALSSLIPDD